MFVGFRFSLKCIKLIFQELSNLLVHVPKNLYFIKFSSFRLITIKIGKQ